MALTEFREAMPVRRGFDRLTPLGDACQAILAHCSPLPGIKKPIDLALGQTCAVNIVAPSAIPGEAIALRDGFALTALETIGASAYAPAFLLTPPQWVHVGDRLPQSTDAVLPSHAVQESHLPIEILAQAAPGDGVRQQGEDFKAAATMIAAGIKVQPIHLALLRAAAITEIDVRIPRLAIVVQRELPQGDLIGPSLLAIAKVHGVDAHIITMDMSDIQTFSDTLSDIDADMIACIGGTGFGDHDHAAAALEKAGTLLVYGIAMRPGETAGCGIIQQPAGTCPVILLPGRIEAAFAVWLSLVLPCLRKLAGAQSTKPGETLTLARKITSNPGIADIVLLRRTTFEDKTGWEPLASGDLPWQALALAEAWHVVPPESEGYPAGALLCAEEI